MKKNAHNWNHKRTPIKEFSFYRETSVDFLTDDNIIKAFKKAPDNRNNQCSDNGSYDPCFVKIRGNHNTQWFVPLKLSWKENKKNIREKKHDRPKHSFDCVFPTKSETCERFFTH